jgi:hypothetical protein
MGRAFTIHRWAQSELPGDWIAAYRRGLVGDE